MAVNQNLSPRSAFYFYVHEKGYDEYKVQTLRASPVVGLEVESDPKYGSGS
jgi:hypothetical protein